MSDSTRIRAIVELATESSVVNNGGQYWKVTSALENAINTLARDGAEDVSFVWGGVIEATAFDVPSNRRRRSGLAQSFTYSMDDILKGWNGTYRKIPLVAKSDVAETMWAKITSRVRRMRPAILSIEQSAFRGDVAVLREMSAAELLDNGLMNIIHDKVNENFHKFLNDTITEVFDTYIDGEIEDGLISRLREELVDNRINEFFSGQTNTPTEPF